MIDTLLGVLVGGLITTVSSLIIQSRSARTIARSEIYVELLERARIGPTTGVSSQVAVQAISSLRRRAVLLGRSEASAAVKAEQLLIRAQQILADERSTGHPHATEYTSILGEYDEQLDALERIISRRLRWPT